MKRYLLEMYRRKDLLFYLVISGLKAQYKNTVLGYLWWIIDPLLFGGVYYFLRVYILGMEGENIGAFLIIGLIAWKWIMQTVNTSAKSISTKSAIITQVYLPKAILPFGAVLTQLFNFSFGIIVIAAFMAIYGLLPGIEIMWFPFIIFVQFLFLSAISLVLGYYCHFIRDIDNVLSHFMRLWFYASPVIWEEGLLPARFSFILDINPAATLIISYRNVLMYQRGPEEGKLLLLAVISFAITIYMIYFYKNNEHKIIKAI